MNWDWLCDVVMCLTVELVEVWIAIQKFGNVKGGAVYITFAKIDVTVLFIIL